jgi:hypothetical protein
MLVVCCTIGAVVGLSLPGGAALGACAGAAVGIGAGRLLHGHRSSPRH